MTIEFKLPLHTVRRHNRREEFQKYFMDNVKMGTIDVQALAKKTHLAERTALAFLKELRINGFADCKILRPRVYGFQLYMGVWSRIK